MTGDDAGDGHGCGRLYGSGTLECVLVNREKRLGKKNVDQYGIGIVLQCRVDSRYS